MGKRGKKPAKSETPEEEDEVEVKEEKVAKGKRGASKTTAFDLANVFSQSFQDRLSQYISLNAEVLTLKGEAEGSDQTEQINQRR